MNDNIKNLLTTLSILQRVDTAQADLVKNLDGVDQRIEALSDQLVALQEQVDQGKQNLEDQKKQYRDDEREVKTIESSIIRSNEKLHSVKTNKEYNSLLKEIDDQKAKKSQIEDRMLENLETIEIEEKKVASLKADLLDMQQEVEEQKNSIHKDADDKRRELASLNEEREELWSELEPKMQGLYTRTKQQCGGIAVAAVDNATCQECRMNIPPQAYIELMRLNSMDMCPHCQRIIYPKSVIEGEA